MYLCGLDCVGSILSPLAVFWTRQCTFEFYKSLAIYWPYVLLSAYKDKQRTGITEYTKNYKHYVVAYLSSAGVSWRILNSKSKVK
jgi:hypothetical protein